MNAKKIFAVLSVILMCFAPIVLCASESSAVSYEETSMKDAVFSRATVTYLKGVSYGEHMDRSDCWFFIDGSANETAFVKYVTRQSDTVPSADDKDELKDRLSKDPTVSCNIYNLGAYAKFNVNAPLLTIDYVHVVLNKGQRLTVMMECGISNGYLIKSSVSSDIMSWASGRQYMTTCSEDNVSYDIMPYNEALYGGTINLKELFIKVTYDVSIASENEFNGNNVIVAVVLFIMGAAVIAVILLCSRKIAWAKDAADPGMIPDDTDKPDKNDK